MSESFRSWTCLSPQLYNFIFQYHNINLVFPLSTMCIQREKHGAIKKWRQISYSLCFNSQEICFIFVCVCVFLQNKVVHSHSVIMDGCHFEFIHVYILLFDKRFTLMMSPYVSMKTSVYECSWMRALGSLTLALYLEMGAGK